ncbi:MAG TPA: efflux RND transporter periplasmic adaptor subunit [Pirellulaceae bacterium]|nr:efflux RND transporter periplasmic adaptor subunit [Pirellulaceae bacterium]
MPAAISTTSTTAPSPAARGKRSPFRLYLAGGALALILAAVLYATTAYWWPLLFATEHEPVAVRKATPSAASPHEVTLPEEKLAAAGLAIGKAEEQSLALTQTVPGQMEYNSSQRLEVKSPAAGVVQEVLVEPGQSLQAGEKLLVLTSNEIGLARDQLLSHEADLELARQQLAFHTEIASNVAELLQFVKEAPTLVAVEQRFAGKLLGDYRDRVVAAYSKLKLAEAVASSTLGLTGQGVISGRLAEERQSTREVASAGFQAACEQATFEAKQELARSKANADHCERLQKISAQNLNALLGPYADRMSVGPDQLSACTLCAPLAATVQERRVSSSERVALGQTLYVLANTQSLMIAAEIHERDWQLLKVEAGQQLQVHSPALPGQQFTAVVKRVGAAVSPETRAVPLVAEIANDAGLFKPGMFVWVTIPQEASRPAVVVPTAAIVRQGEQAFVFVPRSADRFERIDVQLGRETPELCEVTSGLKPGDAVVTAGAFFLKSELLLEREAE